MFLLAGTKQQIEHCLAYIMKATAAGALATVVVVFGAAFAHIDGVSGQVGPPNVIFPPLAFSHFSLTRNYWRANQ